MHLSSVCLLLFVCVCSSRCIVIVDHKFASCHATISMSLTNESVSGDERIESTWDRCGDANKLCVDVKIGSPMHELMSMWWWLLLFWLCDWLWWCEDDNNGSQCCIVMSLVPFDMLQLPFRLFVWPPMPFDWLFMSLLCNDDDGDDGDCGELSKWCDSIGSPWTGWWSSSIKSSIWLRLRVAASETTSGICWRKKESILFEIRLGSHQHAKLPCRQCPLEAEDGFLWGWTYLEMNSPIANYTCYYCYYCNY